MDNQHGDRVLIVGAGAGGAAFLDVFADEHLIHVAGIVDFDENAVGIQHAKARDIPVFSDLETALDCVGKCMVFNMTNDDHLSDIAAGKVGTGGVIGGKEAKLFWQIISRLQTTQEELWENQSRLKAVIHNVCEGIVTIDTKGKIENVNPAIGQIFGYKQDELIGQNISLLMPEPHKELHDSYIHNYMRTGEGNVLGRYREVSGLRQNGEVFPLELNVNEMKLAGENHFVGILRDISERKEAEKTMAQLALYDQLTMLPNRTLFYERMESSLSQAQRTKSSVALLFIDLDGFKSVNDTLGHDMGDHLLVEVGKRLLQCIRDSDVAARIGGDEFTVLLTNLHDIDVAAVIANKIIHALNQPVTFKGNSCHVGASIGIATYPSPAADVDDLVKEADTAMYEAKNAGKNRYSIAKLTM
ncbi:MAG: diguanylate cyclase [Mariprofundus sp.]|nr:diguanylate cyclase [Mariprofundus sp.]